MKYLLPILLLTLVFAASCEDETPCVESTWYEDADNDGLGNPSSSLSACEQPDGYVDNSSDTDDTEMSSATIASYGDALTAQVVNGDGNGIDGTFRNKSICLVCPFG